MLHTLQKPLFRDHQYRQRFRRHCRYYRVRTMDVLFTPVQGRPQLDYIPRPDDYRLW